MSSACLLTVQFLSISDENMAKGENAGKQPKKGYASKNKGGAATSERTGNNENRILENLDDQIQEKG